MYPGALSKSWPEQYTAFGAGQAALGNAWANLTKFVVAGNPLDKGFGKFLRTNPSPGRRIGGSLIRRNDIFGNTSYSVNTFSDKKYHEAYYLFLQWAGSARIYTWLVANTAGYYDPNRIWSLDDPLVRASYQPYAADEEKEIIPRAYPDIAILGSQDYHQALDINMQKAMSGQMSAAAAMKAIAQEWDAITQRIGVSKQVAAIKAEKAAWSSATGPG
jgi:multiple sugar transport system substrate-binding protein